MDNNKDRIPLGKLAIGIVLLLVGILSFTDYLDVYDIEDLVRLWPALLIFIGVSSEIDALRERRDGGGYILAAIGVWLLFAINHFFGLTARTAMPLGIAVIGLGIIVHALVDAPVPAHKENGNDR